MPRFFTGDELGTIKSISYTQGSSSKEWKAATSVLVASGSSTRRKIVQKLALHRTSETDTLLAAVHADASAVVYRLQDGIAPPAVVHEWSETRLKDGEVFVGLSASELKTISCTSNGAMRLTSLGQDGSEPASSLATLPTRLKEWRLTGDSQAFAYGGDEVELSLWETERAFAQSSEEPIVPPDSKKRKRGDQLLSGELWRAKNVPNDHLSLRQPVHITALTFLQASLSPGSQHLLAGTAQGHIRRYDTRVARRPVADWKGVAKAGGINVVEKGFHEHEVFFSDQGTTLSALDLRNGRTIYTFKELSGAVVAIAPAPNYMASASRDRFVRYHSTFGPPIEAKHQQEQKGEILDKLYVKVTPTAILWDGITNTGGYTPEGDDKEEDVDDVWDTMEAVDSGSEDGGKPDHKGKKKRST